MKRAGWMVKFNHEFNVVSRTRKGAQKLARSFARSIGMVAENIKLEKKGTARVKGKQVWRVATTLRDRKKKKKRK